MSDHSPANKPCRSLRSTLLYALTRRQHHKDSSGAALVLLRNSRLIQKLKPSLFASLFFKTYVQRLTAATMTLANDHMSQKQQRAVEPIAIIGMGE